jgi:hypothetical protein
MSQVILCDVCGARLAILKARLVIESPEHPHNREPISKHGEAIDVCLPCLIAVPDLKTEFNLEELQHVVRRRRVTLDK